MRRREVAHEKTGYLSYNEAVDSLLSGIGEILSRCTLGDENCRVTSNDNYAEMMTSQLLGDFLF